MASTGGDPVANLQGLFASLRPSTSRNSSSSHRFDGNAASSAPLSNNLQNRPIRPPSSLTSQPPQSFITEPRRSVTEPHTVNARSNEQSFHSNENAMNVTSADEPANADRTANLLNLLKFSTPSSAQQSQQHSHQISDRSKSQPKQQHNPPTAPRPSHGDLSATPDAHSVHGRGISASDLVASLMGKQSTPTSQAPRETTPKPTTSANHQDFLLKLLNQSSAPHSEMGSASSKPRSDEANIGSIAQGMAETSLEDQRATPSGRKESPIRVFGSNDEQTTPFEPQDMPKLEPAAKKDGIFTYVNPFEQLAASSPLNAKSRVVSGDGHKRKIKEPSPGPVQSSSRRKLTPSGDDILQSIESPTPTPLNDGRTQIEALIGIGAPTDNPETVAEALNQVGGQVDREVEKAFANAQEKEKQAELKKEELERAQEETIEAMAENALETVAEVKEELEKEENQRLLEKELTTPVAEAVKELLDDVPTEARPDELEDGDGAESRFRAKGERVVPVYQFPMRPFVAIDITKKDLPSLDIPEDSIVDVARFKKEFDQIDRTLATATHDVIIYGIAKPGGIRIIRQDDGADQQIFKNTKDRVFNVCISSAHEKSPSRGTQTIIATGVSGSVYWATVANLGGLTFEATKMEKEGLIIPPSPAQSDSPSTGQLKTRAKKSSRHPEFFAIGRGKVINVVFPQHARTSNFVNDESIMDTDKYFQERTLKISTGKAGKDFVFSEDDTTITTLDKVGRLKIWDIRDLTDERNATASMVAPVEIKSPLFSLIATRTSEKSWPTSVLLLDRMRAYQKGIAQRYVLVGMKQNHTLQLVDLLLGKVVQELNFPHEQESDAICSIAYHPASGIIVLAHPTRNSIYFIHLSAPKYTMTPMSQADFVYKVAKNDPSLPKTDVTAIMSGIREYSFASKGQLRSVDLLPSNSEATKVQEDDDSTLFELYVMHSRGVTCLNIKKEDLGLSPESKVLHPVKAEEEGYVVVKDLRQPQTASGSDVTPANGDNVPVAATQPTLKSRSTKSEGGTNAPLPAAKSQSDDPQPDPVDAPVTTSTEQEQPAPELTSSGPSESRSEKKKKKRAAAAEAQSKVNEDPQSAAPPLESIANTAQREPSPEIRRQSQPLANGDSISLGISGDFLDKELKKIEVGVSTEFNKVFNRELGSLYRRINEDRRVQDAAGSAKQDAILRLISSSLTENVEKALSRIIQSNIQQSVIPAIADVLSSALDKRLSEALTQNLHHALPALLKLALPEAVSRSLQNQDVLRVLSDQVNSKIAGHVEKEFASVLHNSITPSFKSLAISVTQKTSLEIENRVREQLRQAEFQRQNDSAKIDDLTQLVRGLSETINTMATAQSEFQQEILKLQAQAAQERQATMIRDASREQKEASQGSSSSAAIQMTPEQVELNAISNMMGEQRYEEAIIQVCPIKPLHTGCDTNGLKWLQSGPQQDYIFNNFLVRCNPGFLQQLSPLVTISVGAAITGNLDVNIMERLAWLEAVLANIDPRVMHLEAFGSMTF